MNHNLAVAQRTTGNTQFNIQGLTPREILVRGTLNWHTRASGRYPGITRGERGKVIGRRVRLDHVAWLAPLLARHKAYRQTEAQLRRLHQLTLALAETVRAARLYDYEPQASADNYLVKVAPAYAPLIYRRAAAAVCTVSGVPRRACFVRRV